MKELTELLQLLRDLIGCLFVLFLIAVASVLAVAFGWDRSRSNEDGESNSGGRQDPS